MRTFPANKNISKLRRVKFGIDPTTSRLHLGHLTPLLQVKKLHNEHRDITIVLGTLTAQFGDPSGRDTARPMLESWLVESNADAIETTVKKLMPNVRIVRNADLHKGLTVKELLAILSSHTLASVLQRHGFIKRESVGVHELLVPFLQALDSVVLETQLEIGGEDQLFNFSLTRDIQIQHHQSPEVGLLFPILNGTDGTKMSKSAGNCIFLDTPIEEFRKQVLSISDSVMNEWFCLFSKEQPAEHPFERKKQLAEILCLTLN